MANGRPTNGGGGNRPIYIVALVLLFLGKICTTTMATVMKAPAAPMFYRISTSSANEGGETNRHNPPSSVGTKIAIVRPFSMNDASKLPGSFAVWSTLPPCDVAKNRSSNGEEGPNQPSYTADLYIAFSQSLDGVVDESNTNRDRGRNNIFIRRNESSYPFTHTNTRNSSTILSSPAMMARAMMDAVGSIFHDTNGWQGCIHRVYGFGCNIDPTMDLYKIGESGSNPLWVNGPNRQFERTMRAIQHRGQSTNSTSSFSAAGPYDATYLMEMDSVPVKHYWLDRLVDEIENRSSDFAILGSKYRGYKWDPFYSKLDESLVNHLNGNAVYNLSHPVLDRILTVLESEANTVGNTIPYDYRIAQLVADGLAGVEPAFDDYFVRNLGLQPPSRVNYSTLFLSDVRAEDTLANVIRETNLIGNYASTNMLEVYFDPKEVIVHGAKMYHPWDSKKLGNVTLVVSDWNSPSSFTLLSTLDASLHPFSEVVVMLPDDADLITIDFPVYSAAVRFVRRGANPDYMDLCTAPVRTRWFMKVSSAFRVRPIFHLMVHHQMKQSDDDDGQSSTHFQPVASYSEATNETCFHFPYCVMEFDVARVIAPPVHRVFSSENFLFETPTRDEYCRTRGDVFGPKAPPSATSYVAYLHVNDHRDETLYHFSEHRMDGMLSAFVRLPPTKLITTSITTTTDMALNHHQHLYYHHRVQKGRGVRRQLQGNGTDGDGGGGNATVDDEGCIELVTNETCITSGCEWTNFGCRTPNGPGTPSPPNITSQQRAVSSRPGWATALMLLAIVSGAIALLLAVAVIYRNQSVILRGTNNTADRDTNSSLVPVVHRGGRGGGGGGMRLSGRGGGGLTDDDDDGGGDYENDDENHPINTSRILRTSSLMMMGDGVGGVAGRGSTGIDSSLYLASTDNSGDGSFRTIDLQGLAVLDDGTFEEYSDGVEYVKAHHTY